MRKHPKNQKSVLSLPPPRVVAPTAVGLATLWAGRYRDLEGKGRDAMDYMRHYAEAADFVTSHLNEMDSNGERIAWLMSLVVCMGDMAGTLTAACADITGCEISDITEMLAGTK